MPILIPPLRERKDDVLPLVDHLLKKNAARFQKKVTHVLPEVMAAFCRYEWPGNIRELENAVERMVLMSESDVLGPDHVPPEILASVPQDEVPTFKNNVDGISRAAEKQLIMDALDKTGQNRSRAAEVLGISRRTLQNKIKEYGL